MEKQTGSKLGKEYNKAVSPCLFNFYPEYIVPNAGLDESQAGITTAWRNINNLRYTDDTTLLGQSEEEVKNHLMRVKEEIEKAGLNETQHSKNEDHRLWSYHFMANRRKQ